ncbi:CoA transferase [Mycobacterium frederiksbergense]|uniref:CoA transferase n=1 Tax=Mycolicibacterium frederiksbergense TaxID=117567 RepID=A0A6H0S0H9_9MYCO|nr:CoA transferase [Mycolicibacterium frederiksbergense]MCV7047402.1 CoA transferase [Mycolicibacterium frederiksbergense]QIV80710.1 CoA transferase [Mycolicibacterium frederiksbergense]
MPYDPPLSGVRVLDLTTGPMTAVGRLLADLGAHVIVVALQGVSSQDEPVPLDTAMNRHGLDTVTVTDPDTWTRMLAGADILVENTAPGSAAETALAVRAIRTAHPALVILSISDFGRDTRFRNWQATTPVLHALTSELSRSGIPGREPLVPPGRHLPYQVAAAQAAVFTVSVLLDRLRTGEGDLIDFSVLDGAMQTLDPPYGTAGTASAGVALSAQKRNWAAEQLRYPIIACRDGHVRICLLAKRQWEGMFEWLGRPAEFADPKYYSLRERLTSVQLLGAIGRFCADKTRAELEEQGQRHRVPTAAVLSLAEALRSEHVRERGFFRDVELSTGVTAPVPVGIVEIDGHRASTLNSPTTPTARPAGAPILAGRTRRDQGLPLEGLRVLDLGVIVVGSDTGRLFGDLGADVVKIENSAFPDGLRGNLASISHTYAAGHRNKKSISIDLRIPEGQALAHRLVESADVVLTNFKPGVAAALGMDHDTLRLINPGIVVVDSSAFGPTGPWANRLGYGPLVRAAAGFTDQWAYPGESDAFCDAVTVYPDHVAARIGALAALALLLRRERTGAGGAASVAQSEVMISHLAAEIAGKVLDLPEQPPAHPWGVFPAKGDGAWVAVTVRDDADDRALRTVIGARSLPEWTAEHSAEEAMDLLQSAGVPAGAVLHAADVPGWAYYVDRRAFREELHPHGREPYILENAQIHSDRIADPPLGQAPLLGEQTRELAAELLGLSQDEIDDLMARGVLESVAEAAAEPR